MLRSSQRGHRLSGLLQICWTGRLAAVRATVDYLVNSDQCVWIMTRLMRWYGAEGELFALDEEDEEDLWVYEDILDSDFEA
uniref:Uncharacterized protein n=1 Tax=Hyaloperonospora arabidopsidis (strain Emoy2) TaxID=559515 RepID=M4BMY4_HYAAE